MPYYDIVFESCEIDDNLAARLGFGKILTIPKDVELIELGKRGIGNDKNVIASGPVGSLVSAANAGAAAVLVGDAEIDKRLIAAMADNDTVLCMPLSDIMGLYGLKRSRLMFKMNRLFTYARKQGVDVSFATLARSNSTMCSYMQIIELARLLGVPEGYARKSISEVNRRFVVK